MKFLAIFLVLTATALPGMASRRVTVAQLEQLLARTEAKSDADIARELASVELSERLSGERLVQLSAALPGEKARQALLVMADSSAFLEPPAAEIPGTATPSDAAQHRMMALTVEYLGKSLPTLPNLFAVRETSHFESKPEGTERTGAGDNPLRAAGRSSMTVVYRDHREFVDTGTTKEKQPKPQDMGLTTWGEFGPILGTVIIDAARSQLTWSHWELNATGPQAVFHYRVPKEKSHYDVRFCCFAESYGLEVKEARQRAGYHGEITVDPDTGAILRLTVEADLPQGNPISVASIAVEYAPVEIGDKTYICPSRGIALAQAPDAKSMHALLYPGGSDKALPPLQKASLPMATVGAQQTLLNDIAFRHYHLFRADARIVSDNDAGASSTADASPAAAPGAQTTEILRPAEEVAAENAAAAASETNRTLAAHPAPAAETAAAAPAETAAAAPEVNGVVPEISVTEATGLPRDPSPGRQSTPDGGFTLRINSRLVDIAVVAVDKKGRPVTNLKPEDFEIYDDGKKQDVHSYEQAGIQASAPPSSQTAGQNGTQPQTEQAQAAYTNHSANAAKAAAGTTEGNTIILLVDGSNLSIVDFSDARQQMVRFLKGLPDNAPVALYAMRYHSFQVVQETTTDHELLAAKLAKWVPAAQDLANANDEEQRNRQTIETVHSPEDLLSVNGNNTLDPESQTEALDPKLRTLGSDPVHIALDLMVDIARHLASVPGHKSLVWVTSDNVLADWNQASVTIERGSKFIEPFALRAQEAMNNAHVSVYPLDASHLEANVITADVGRRNVELTATFQAPPGLEAAREGPEMTAGPDVNPFGQGRDLRPGRLTAQMQQDLHSIQGVFREVADATGGRAFPRSSNIIGELNGVVADGRATYMLGFAPSDAADGKYHVLTVKVTGRKDIALRYRTGYQYDKDPSSVKDRFSKAAWEPADMSDISISATPAAADRGTLKLNISATDLALAQDGNLWTDKVGIFLVRRDDTGLHAQVTGRTMSLKLKPETYQKLLREGIPFEQIVEQNKATGAVRIVVVDENSGRMGTITIPAAELMAKQ